MEIFLVGVPHPEITGLSGHPRLNHAISIYLPGVLKTGLVNLNLFSNFSRLLLSNISLFTVLFTAHVRVFIVF